jgi:hypothetical protein
VPRDTQAFGPAIVKLKNEGILPNDLAVQLFAFNSAINVPSKHFGAYLPTPWLNERTFSVIETTEAIVVMRKLSIQLFTILKNRGISLAYEWPEFKEDWLSWYQKRNLPQSDEDSEDEDSQ